MTQNFFCQLLYYAWKKIYMNDISTAILILISETVIFRQWTSEQETSEQPL